jgi:hypothetical protein
MLLCNTTAADAVIFNDAPVAVLFATLLSRSLSQEHAAIVYQMKVAARG